MGPEFFYETGSKDVQLMTRMLERYGARVEDLEAILDFGCGCGRVIRHWRRATRARLHGTDYNPHMINWCRANLPFAAFEVNGLEPELSHDDQAFDLIYGVSVFTHLRESLQRPWINELTRMLRPGGLLLLTLHGRTRVDSLDSEETRRFESGELVVREPELSGSDFCATWHPERYIRETLGRGLEILDYSPGGARDSQQDTVLFSKPPASRT
jgi:SAM-dependent methyltransferase